MTRCSPDTRPLTIVPSLLLGLAITGCSSFPATLHQDYANLRPGVISIPPVENMTLHDNLRSYRTAGALQTLLLDAREMDILASFRRGAEEVLQDGGYRTTLVESDGVSDADARLDIRLWSWGVDSGFDHRGFNAEFEVRLTRNEGGELLYERRFPYRMSARGNAPITAVSIESGIRAAMKNALYRLPPAGL